MTRSLHPQIDAPVVVLPAVPEARAAVRVPIGTLADVVTARRSARLIAEQLGFGAGELPLIAAAISELAHNILAHAGHGVIALAPLAGGASPGLLVIARDQGPGIRDVGDAVRSGVSPEGQVKLGLPGVRRVMDDLEIDSRVGRGTTVRARKWT